MTNADLSKLRETKGCGLKATSHTFGHHKAVDYAADCVPCLTLLVDAARAGAVEECAKVVEALKSPSESDGYPLAKCRAFDEGTEQAVRAIRALLNPPSATAKETISELDMYTCPQCGHHDSKWLLLKDGKHGCKVCWAYVLTLGELSNKLAAGMDEAKKKRESIEPPTAVKREGEKGKQSE